MLGVHASSGTDSRTVFDDLRAAGKIAYIVGAMITGILLFGAAMGGSLPNGYAWFALFLGGSTGVLMGIGVLWAKYGPFSQRWNWYVLFGVVNVIMLIAHFTH